RRDLGVPPDEMRADLVERRVNRTKEPAYELLRGARRDEDYGEEPARPCSGDGDVVRVDDDGEPAGILTRQRDRVGSRDEGAISDLDGARVLADACAENHVARRSRKGREEPLEEVERELARREAALVAFVRHGERLCGAQPLAERRAPAGSAR